MPPTALDGNGHPVDVDDELVVGADGLVVGVDGLAVGVVGPVVGVDGPVVGVVGLVVGAGGLTTMVNVAVAVCAGVSPSATVTATV